MKRQEAEKLLAALIFDDLDEASKADLQAYLQTDDELRERLADMRMAAKVATDTLAHGPEPTLSDQRLKHLAKLAKHQPRGPRIFTLGRLVAAAAVLLVAITVLSPTLNKKRLRQLAFSNVAEKDDFMREPYEAPATEAGRRSELKLTGGTSLSIASDEGDGPVLVERPSEETRKSELSTVSARSSGRMTPDEAKDWFRGYTVETTGKEVALHDDSLSYAIPPEQSADSKKPAPVTEPESRGRRPAGPGSAPPSPTIVANSAPQRTPTSGEAVQGDTRLELLGGDYRDATDKDVDTDALDAYSMILDAATAEAKEPAPASESTPTLYYRASNLDSRVVASDAGSVTSLDQLGSHGVALDFTNGAAPTNAPRMGGGTFQAGRASVSSLSTSQPVAGEPVTEGLAAAPPSDSPATASYDTAVTYQWWGDVTSSKEPVTFPGEVSSETSSAKQNLNERGEELVRSARPEVADQEATRYGVYSYAATTEAKPQPLAEQEAQSTLLGTEVSNEIEAFQELKEVADVSGPEADREQKPKEVEELTKKLAAVTRSQDTAEKYDVDDLALPEGARFKVVPVNPWVMTDRDSLSTFALDVDTASYTLSRRYIQSGFLPPIGAVRMEEFVNYFDYQYPQRSTPTFAVHAEAAPSPFARPDKNLTMLKIGVKARTLGRDQQRPAHLVFVIDASASMGQADRLPLVQEALGLLVDKLSPADRVSLITCADQGRLHLETMPASQRAAIRQKIEAIQPAGPTNLLAGLKLGYALAKKAFVPNQINHVVLCSDGVANVGQTEAENVLQAVAKDRKQGITLTCIGVGYGTYNDAFLEALANQGDGSYLFLDSPQQARETFVDKFSAALQVVAKNARIQVSFNAQRVRRYRLIGYENRDIEDARFRDDTVDAGEVGSGQCSTALYELELIGQPSADGAGDLGTVFVRYRDVESGQMEEISSRLTDSMVGRPTVSDRPRFFLAGAVVRFAEWLRQSEHAQDTNLSEVLATVEQVSLTLPLDRDVRELAELIRKAEHLPRAP